MKTKFSITKVMFATSLSFIISLGCFADNNQQARSVLSAYLQIKDALVKTDSKAASTAAKSLVALVGEDSDDLSKKLKTNAKQIMESTDVAVQRKHFNDLSENMLALVKSSSNNDMPLYKQFCPMAFNNTGAFWLATEKEINNPYFGDMMLHCGMVKEEL